MDTAITILLALCALVTIGIVLTLIWENTEIKKNKKIQTSVVVICIISGITAAALFM